jgi:uncharacterized protein
VLPTFDPFPFDLHPLPFVSLSRFVNLARMKITEEFVEMMICPACQSKVRLREDGSAIKCLGCRRVYPIEDDMPMMLADKATIEDEETTTTTNITAADTRPA